MEVGPGELFDKLSISLLKSERLSAEQFHEELDELEEAFAQTVRIHPNISVQCSDLLDLLKIINAYPYPELCPDLCTFPSADIQASSRILMGIEDWYFHQDV